MTRKKFKFKDDSVLSAAMYNKAIDVAFNYFESRTCNTCKHENKITMSGGARSCLLLEIGIWKDFGCNKYEPKDE